jgi:hypothetical protein
MLRVEHHQLWVLLRAPRIFNKLRPTDIFKDLSGKGIEFQAFNETLGSAFVKEEEVWHRGLWGVQVSGRFHQMLRASTLDWSALDSFARAGMGLVSWKVTVLFFAASSQR